MQSYPKQAQFFVQLRRHLGLTHAKPIVAEMQRLFDWRKPDQAYQRIRGKVRMSYDESMAIMQAFQFTPRLGTGEAVWSMGSVHELSSLQQEMENTLAAEDKLYFSSTEIPVFYLFDSPLLTALKLHYWEHHADPTASPQLPAFRYDRAAFVQRESYRYLQRCGALYRQINREELFMSGMFDNQCYQVVRLAEEQGIESDVISAFKAEIMALVDKLEHEVADAKNTHVRVHANEQSSTGGRVLREDRHRDIVYLTGVDLRIAKFRDPVLYQFFEKEWNRQCSPQRATLLSGGGRRDRAVFFRRLRRRIAHVLEEIE